MASPGGHRVPRLLLGFLVAAAAAEPGAAPPPGQVCGEGCCAGPAPEGSAVAAFCGNRTGAELRGRCCVDGATEQEAVVVVGLDLGNCSLTTLCSGFQEARTAVIIDLTVWLCPEASLCTPDGPGLFQCLCMSPYHGYKCLRQGSFPYLLFLGTLGTATAILSILLWVTQRRKAKTS